MLTAEEFENLFPGELLIIDVEALCGLYDDIDSEVFLRAEPNMEHDDAGHRIGTPEYYHKWGWTVEANSGDACEYLGRDDDYLPVLETAAGDEYVRIIVVYETVTGREIRLTEKEARAALALLA